MLRNFFLASDSTTSSKSLDVAKKPKAERSGDDDTKFAEMIMRLGRFEGDNLMTFTGYGLTLHIAYKQRRSKKYNHQALASLPSHLRYNELVTSSGDLESYLQSLYNDETVVKKNEEQSESEAHKILTNISTFRTSLISPLQAMLADIAQLKLRCDHRNSARSVMIRYDMKLSEIQLSTRYESPRLRRNRVKYQVAVARFKAIDSEVLANGAVVLTNSLSDIAKQSIETLFVQHQVLTAEWMQAKAKSLQKQELGEFGILSTESQEPGLLAVREVRVTDEEADANPNHQNNANNGTAADKPSVTSRPSHEPSSPPCLAPTTISSKQPQSDDLLRITPNHFLNQKQGTLSQKKHTHGTRTWNLHRHIKDSMACGLDLAECIQLPEGCQLDEWVAVHAIDFFNEISLLFGTISEFCNHTTCPQMSAGPCYTYLWADGVEQVTPISLPASEYIARLLEWVERQFDDPQLFPHVYVTSSNTSDVESNPQFMRAARNIFKRLFRVYAHMYHNHLQNYTALQAETHLNFCFKRFVLFVRQFELIEQKELNALRKLIETLVMTKQPIAHF